MSRPLFAVYAVRRGAVWTCAGRGVGNVDGSINITLDVLPVAGQLHVRPLPEEGKPLRVLFVVLGSDLDLVVMLEEQGTARQLAVLAGGQGHPIDLVFNQVLELAKTHEAELADRWISLAGPPVPTK